jgi:four helix bundle protein
MPINTYKDLVVWQKSLELAEKVYIRSDELPKREQFALVSQIQRSATSIPSNIAEGFSRNNRGEYLHFVGIARGSAAELETQLLLVGKVYGLDLTDEMSLLTEVRKMLTRLSQKLRLPTTL